MNKVGKKKILGKILFITVVLLVINAVLLSPLLNLYNFSNNSNKLAFWGGIIGSFLGVLGAYFAAYLQIKAQRHENKQQMEPLIVFGNRQPIGIREFDLINKEGKKEPKLRDDKIKISIINGGQSPIFNVSVTYSLCQDVINVMKRDGADINSNKLKSNYSRIFNQPRPYMHQNRLAIPTNINVILPGDSQTLELTPIGLLQFYSQNFKDENEESEERRKYERPFYHGQVKFSDYRNNEKTLKFHINVEVYGFTNSNKECKDFLRTPVHFQGVINTVLDEK